MITEFQNIIEQVVNKFDDQFFWSWKRTENGLEVFYSENIEKVTGYSGEEIKSLPGRGKEIVCQDDLPRYRKLMDEFESEPDRNFAELKYRIVRKDGKVVWINEKITVQRNFNAEITEWFGHVVDVTEPANNLERLNNKISNLEQLNSSKDSFISVLSHDLRAPFTSILGFSEILLNEAGISEKERHEYLNYINDSSQHQLRLINILLDWSRLQTGRLKIEPQRLHVKSLVFNTISLLTGQTVRKNISINVNINDSLYMDADERLIGQVLSSLLNNAIKYSDEDSSVDFSASVYNDEFIEIVVSDEGVGISNANKEKMFNIGKMFSTEGTKGEKGTGLGLALAKQIVEKHNGEIWFYSDEGQGSEFHFTIPSSANTILLVKSDPERRMKLEESICRYFPGFDVISIENSFEALALVSGRMPSLIIAEHSMPLMDGIQFAKTVRKENKNLRVPIIALLNSETENIKQMYQEHGIKTVKDDPVDINTLDEKIRSALELNQ